MSQNVIQMRNRVQLITRQYHYLQGLRHIPVGVLLLILAAAESGWLPWYAFWKPLSDMAVWILVGIAWWCINRYYTTSFGQVRRTPREQMQEYVFAIIFLMAIYLTGIAEYVWSWPVSITSILFSTVWLWPLLPIWLSQTIHLEYHRSTRYLVSTLLMAGVGLLPLTGLVEATEVYLAGGRMSVALLGGLCIINGLLDHRTLVQSLHPVREEA